MTLSLLPQIPIKIANDMLYTQRLIFPEFACNLGTIRDFRNSVNELFRVLELPHEAFYNRDETNRSIHEFPLIQYQAYQYRGHWVASVLALHAGGIEALGSLIEILDNPLLQTKLQKMGFANYLLQKDEFSIDLSTELQTVTVENFVLNQRQALRWQATKSRIVQDQILIPALRFAIFGFLNSLDYHVPDRSLEINIVDIPEGAWQCPAPLRKKENLKTKGQILCMNVVLKTNIMLPKHIGIGIHKAFGFGLIK
jgi:hypothetical protein